MSMCACLHTYMNICTYMSETEAALATGFSIDVYMYIRVCTYMHIYGFTCVHMYRRTCVFVHI